MHRPTRSSCLLAALLLTGCFDGLTQPTTSPAAHVRSASDFAGDFPLAFASSRDGDLEIVQAQGDGSGQRQLTWNAVIDTRPMYSPDGRELLYVSRSAGGDQDLWSMKDDGTRPRIILDNTSDESTPSWSPLGTQVTFASNRDGNFEIYTVTRVGTNLTRLTTDPASDTYSTWSPVGDIIAFQRITAGRFDIWLVNADGTGLRQLTTIGGSNPQWFPTGQKLAFVAPVDGVSQVFTIDVAAGGLPVQLTTSPGHKWFPAIGVDGKVIAFSSAHESADFDVWTVNVDGTGERRLATAPGNDWFPTWR